MMKRRSLIQTALILSLAGGASVLSGCGLKGPLYLEQRKRGPGMNNRQIPLQSTPVDGSPDASGDLQGTDAAALPESSAGSVLRTESELSGSTGQNQNRSAQSAQTVR